MSQKQVLELFFVTEANRSKKLTVQEPREDLTFEQVEPAMQALIDSDLFSASGINPFAQIKNARYVRTEVEDLTVAE